MRETKTVYRVQLTRTITSYIDIEADNEDDAVDTVLIGASVKENGNLDARLDIEPYIVEYGRETENDELVSVEAIGEVDDPDCDDDEEEVEEEEEEEEEEGSDDVE